MSVAPSWKGLRPRLTGAIPLLLTSAALAGCGATHGSSAATTGRGAATGSGPRLFFGPLKGPVLARLRAIYRRGAALGERADVFAKVGDSNTATQGFLRGLGCPGGAARVPTALRSTLAFFAGRRLPAGYTPFAFASPLACPSDSFVRIGFSAHPGWGVAQLLGAFPHPNVRFWHGHLYPVWSRVAGSRVVALEATPEGGCPAGRPVNVACELHAIRPAVALVMIGTNDLVPHLAPSFAADLATVVRDIEAAGTIPVVSTIPPRTGAPAAELAAANQIITGLARADALPLWDFARALAQPGLVAHGLRSDGVHLSVAPAGPDDLQGAATAYGMNLRNLQALEVLKILRRDVFGAPG